MVVVIELVWL